MRLHLVDGTYELFRAHYSKRPARPRKAIVGLIDSLLTLVTDADERLTHVAVAFDNPIRSFRNDLFDGYKTEEGVEAELLAQFDGAEAATRALGMTAWPMDRFEADDALATAAARFAGAVEQVRILTPDKDLGQCIRGQSVVQVDRMRRRVIDEPALTALRGIGPESIPDWLALVGDVADGVPGLPGFGEKSAAALLAAFVRLEDVPDDFRRWPKAVRGAERLAATLAARRDDALLYRTLTRLRTDVPLAETLDQLAWRGVGAGFDAWCTELDADHLRRRAASL
ncbi:MAG TPA: 5'-3' exonuclease H3TH domain-containing protein [Polyangia bacterium]|nr:5'-3' exonuclease H3TH domain-containing protein [Polyangia bacterium]